MNRFDIRRSLLGLTPAPALEIIAEPPKRLPHTIEVVRLLAEHGRCRVVRDILSCSPCGACPGAMGRRPVYWDCCKEGTSAQRWLEEHGYTLS